MGKIVSSVANVFTGANQTRAAGEQAAAQQRQAAQGAAFRPVGMTSAFGTSQFTREIDPTTGLPFISSAGYTAAPELANLQSNIMGNLGGSYAQGADLASQYAPLSQGAQGAFQAGQAVYGYAPIVAGYGANVASYAPELYSQGRGLFSQGQNLFGQGAGISSQAGALFGAGAGYLASPAEAQAQYIANTQAALAPSQEQQLAQIRNQLFQTGRSGLATGGTVAGNMQTSNPELAAYYNSLAQQNLNITQSAQEQARQNVMLGANLYGQGGALSAQGAGITGQGAGIVGQGAGLFGQGAGAYSTAGNLYGQSADIYGQGANLYMQGGNMLNMLAAGRSAAFSPFQTQLGLAQQIDTMSQQPYQMGLQLGQAQQAGQVAGVQGLQQAAQTQYGATQAANASNAQFWGGVVSALGSRK
jgi:hypothetical protein